MNQQSKPTINDQEYGRVVCEPSMIKAIEFDRGSGSVFIDLSDQGLTESMVLIVGIDSVCMTLLASFIQLGVRIAFKTEKATPDKFNGQYYTIQHLGGIRSF